MKLIIAGGRDYFLKESDWIRLDGVNSEFGVVEVVSGAAPGADAGGEEWAAARGVPVKKFPADWKAHGRAAGPIRNKAMAAYADAVALFPGGRGTASMMREALAAGIKVFDFTTA